MPTQTVVSTYFEITSSGATDGDNLYIKVEISKGVTALSGATEAQILGYVKNYLQSLTTNPINVSRVQTTRVDGL